MGGVEVPRGLQCPRCGKGLEPMGEPAPGDEGHRLYCPGCGETFRARRRERMASPGRNGKPTRRPADPKPVGGLSLRLRSLGVRTIARIYPIGVAIGAAVLIPLGGFIPVMRGWLRDEVEDRG